MRLPERSTNQNVSCSVRVLPTVLTKKKYGYSVLDVVVVDELASSGVYSREKKEDNVEQDEGFQLCDGHARFNVQLGQRALPCNDLADDGEGNT